MKFWQKSIWFINPWKYSLINRKLEKKKIDESNNFKSKSGPNSAAKDDIAEDRKIKPLENDISYFNIYSKKEKNKNFN